MTNNGSAGRRNYAAVLATTSSRRIFESVSPVKTPSPVQETPSRFLVYSDTVSMEQPLTACPEYLEGTCFAESYTQLPVSWGERDKGSNIEIMGDDLEVKYVGTSKGSEQDAASVRGNAAMPKSCGIYYYEVEILSKGREGYIGIGFCKANVQLNKLPGWEADSWGYHGDDGNSFCCQATGKPYGPHFSTGDTIGCAVNFRTGAAFYTKNGVDLGVAFRDVGGPVYPSVGMRSAGEHIRANFGQRPFMFDIEHHMQEEKQRALNEIISRPLSASTPDDGLLARTIQTLVASYFAHNGFVESAQAFAVDLKTEQAAFDESIDMDSTEELDTIQRQQIRSAVMEGNVDKALKLTEASYPQVLESQNPVVFKLKCRKFIEMMQLCEAANSKSDCNGNSLVLLNQALEYGQLLQQEYQDDPSPEVKRALQDAFSLLAYTDLSESPLSHLLDESGRIPVAEELNSAILVSQGKSSVAPLTQIIRQSTLLLRELSDIAPSAGAAFINLQRDFLSPS